MPKTLESASRRIAATPAIAVAIALVLLLVSLALALYNEHAGVVERTHQAQVQADILAGSVAAPLAFDDQKAAQEYANALRADPAIEAVGAYDQRDRLVAQFHRQGDPPPASNAVGARVIGSGAIVVTSPVRQGTTTMGSVYLRVSTETLLRRSLRYAGIGAVVVMASLLVAVLGASNASVGEAHRRLQQEIAEREKAEEALRQARKMEAMGQLTGGVAHDFNNLLMVASSGLDLMDRTTDPVRRERLKQGIRQAIERGASLTQQLLAFARRAPVRPEVVDLGERLAAMGDLLDRSLREDITVDLQPAPNLWQVEVDPSQLEVAILNIAINARDAMPAGGRVVIRMQNLPGDGGRGDMVRISVTDTGVGMEPDLAARVFEPFFTTKAVGQGTGLGLSQVYGFARSSGGEVAFESEVGKGSVVSIDIPRSLKAPPPAKRGYPSAAKAQQQVRVLLVEDDDNVAMLVGEMLEELGYRPHRTANAAAALAHLADDADIDLVFSDMIMPGDMNGLELAHEIAALRPGLPVILTTGYSDAAASALAEDLRLLVKPYRIEELAAEFEAALARRSGAKRTRRP